MSYLLTEAAKVNLLDAVKASTDSITYRDYVITWQGRTDWTFAHRDYDGAPDGRDHRCGWEQSLGACMAEIDQQIEDEAAVLKRWWPDATETVAA